MNNKFLEWMSAICVLMQTVLSVLTYISGYTWLSFAAVAIVMGSFGFSIALNQRYKKLYMTIVKDRHITTLRYLVNSSERKKFNPLHLESLDVQCVFTDNPEHRDFLDAELTYTLTGRVTKNNVEAIDLETYLNQINKEIPQVENGGYVVLDLDDLDESGEPAELAVVQTINGNILTNRIFFNKIKGKSKATRDVHLKISRKWAKYCLKNVFDMTMIDPRNYAERIDMISLTAISRSVNFRPQTMRVFTYNRISLSRSEGFSKPYVSNDSSGITFEHTFPKGVITKDHTFAFRLEDPNILAAVNEPKMIEGATQ